MASHGKDGRFFENMKQIKAIRNDLMANGKLFIDKDFPTEIGIESLNDYNIYWKRIKEIDEGAQQYVEGCQVGGAISQGLLGDYSLIATLSAISNHPRLLNYIFPPGQSLNNPAEYCGLFYFRFWIMGKWVYVVVDDRVPVIGWRRGDASKRNPDKRKFKNDDVKEDVVPESSKKVFNKSIETDRLVEKEITDGELGNDLKYNAEMVNESTLLPVGEDKKYDNGNSKDGVKRNHDSINSKPEGKSKETEASSSQNPDDLTGASGADVVSVNRKSDLKYDLEKKEGSKSNAALDNVVDISSKKHAGNLKTSIISSEEGKIAEDSEKLDPTGPTTDGVRKTNDMNPEFSLKSKSSKRNAGEGDCDQNLSKEHKTIFARVFNTDGKIFYWATLLEKAYAKVCGGYHLLPKVGTLESLLEMTGGITETFYTNQLPRNFFLDIKSWSDNHAIIIATTDLDMETKSLPEKASSSMFLAVSRVFLADFRKLLGRDKILGFVRLLSTNGKVKICQQWANAFEEWKILPSLVKRKLKMTVRGENEFYLTYRNFLRASSSIFICIVPDGCNYNCEGYFSEWSKPRLRYDLCKIDELRFHEFSQHKIWVRDPNSEETVADVVISLVQNGRCCCSETPSYSVMQFFLFRLEHDRTYTLPLGFNFFRYNRPIACSYMSSQKEVTSSFKLLPGNYLVVPVTNFPHLVHPCLSNDYLLRVVTHAKFPKAPPPPLSTFSDSENLNIYFDFVETMEIEPKAVFTEDSKESAKPDIDKIGAKDRGRGKKKKIKH